MSWAPTSWRRRIGWSIAAILGLLVALAASLPYLIDVEAYKPALVRAVKDATGRELVIDGPMKLTMWPQPRISAQQVHFANAPGAVGAQMLSVRWIGVSPSWLALLSGRVEVGRLTLYQPSIVLETDADGVPNWHFQPGAGAEQPEGAAAAGFHLAIGSLHIVQGMLSYTNPQTKRTLKVDDLDAVASVQSFAGPFSIAGNATVNGIPLSFDLSVSGDSLSGHDTSFALKVADGRLAFKGTASAIAADAELKGHLSVSSGLLTDFIASIVQATGQPQPKLDGPVVGEFSFDGGLELGPTRLALTDFKLSLGAETASGSVAFGFGKAPALNGHVAVPKVDVERWLALLATPGAFLSPAAPAAPAPAGKTPAPAKPAALSPFPPELDVSLSLDVAELVYRQGTLRDASLAIEIHKGVATMPHFKAVLPGDLVLQASTTPAPPPAKPGAANSGPVAVLATGTLSLAGPHLSETLAWLGLDTAHVPEGRLQAIDLHGNLSVTASQLQFGDLVIDLDGQHVIGSGSVAFGTPLSVTGSLQVDRIDLDAYLAAAKARPATKAADAPTASAAPASGTIAVPAAPPPPDKTLPLFGLKLKVARLRLLEQTLSGIEADATAQGHLLTINALKVGDLLGAKLDAKGTVGEVDGTLRFDVTFNATMPDADKVLDYVGLPTFANGKIGAVTASGQLLGTPDVLAVRNASVNMLGSTGKATGALVVGPSFRFDFSSFALQTPDASRLLAAAVGRPEQGIGALAVEGAFKGDAQRAAFDGALTALGTPMNGHIEATLGKRPNITAKLRIPGTLDLDQWLGVSSGPATPATAAAGGSRAPASPQAAAAGVPLPVASHVTSDKPFDLAALSAFDANLTLETSAVAFASLKVLYCDLQASLQNGVARIAKVTGQFYGGAVDFSGTVDAAKQSLAIDLGGSLQGIYLGEMLRGTTGRNVFGNDHLMVAMDGKVNINGIALEGSGTTPQQLRDSLSGRGQVTGYLYPGVASGSLGFAQFATGLGSLFSTDLGFGSAVLSGFVNHQNDFSGELLLSGSTVVLKDHTLKGLNATALVNSTNSLVHETTDTVVALDTSGNGSPDYVMTVKGPIASPEVTTRGR